jgi:NhaA family Na+:H+ antiporter
LLNRIGVREVPIYILAGIAIWVGFYKAGIHPTIAGVVLGLMTPATAWIRRKTFLEVMGDFWDSIRQDREADEAQNDSNHPSNERHVPINLEQLRFLARESHSPLHRLEMGLHPWVAYAIMPIFALANAGVELDPEALTSGVSIAVATGLALGKPLGIFLFCFLAVRMGWTRLPNGVNWPIFLGGACLGGIGFTMALSQRSVLSGRGLSGARRCWKDWYTRRLGHQRRVGNCDSAEFHKKFFEPRQSLGLLRGNSLRMMK